MKRPKKFCTAARLTTASREVVDGDIQQRPAVTTPPNYCRMHQPYLRGTTRKSDDEVKVWASDESRLCCSPAARGVGAGRS
jgi:hypothetical protein